MDEIITKNGMEVVLIKTKSGSSAKIHLWGATVTSFITQNGVEKLFISDLAKFDNSTPIRGGIPLVFPQFGSGKAVSVSHGFARRCIWTYNGASSELEGTTQATFSLRDNEYTRSLWDYSFELEYKVTISGSTLSTRLIVKNTDAKVFDFQALLHTYYLLPGVQGIKVTSVTGLSDVKYMDKLSETGDLILEKRTGIQFDGETDSVYHDSPSQCKIVVRVVGTNKTDNGGDKATTTTPKTCSTTITIDRVTSDDSNIGDFVVWNPWIEKSIKMGDFSDDEYLKMLCVEPGFVSQWKSLAAGGEWFIEQRINYE